LFSAPASPPVLLSFPTRRSSDLASAFDPRYGRHSVGMHADPPFSARGDVFVERLLDFLQIGRPSPFYDGPIAFVDLALAQHAMQDRKSTRLNSSHSQISYAVFCL